jgi:hypothetical protein
MASSEDQSMKEAGEIKSVANAIKEFDSTAFRKFRTSVVPDYRGQSPQQFLRLARKEVTSIMSWIVEVQIDSSESKISKCLHI